MRERSSLLLAFAVAVTLLLTVNCASNDRVDKLEENVRVIKAQVSEQTRQQQGTEADVAQKLSVISESMNTVDQRLLNLETTASKLSKSDDDMRRQVSEIESKLDDRAIKRILTKPLTYIVAIVILLLGIVIGVYGCCWKAR